MRLSMILRSSSHLLPPGHAPAAALFASHGRYKREAYRGSEFAPRILADNGLSVVMKVIHHDTLTVFRDADLGCSLITPSWTPASFYTRPSKHTTTASPPTWRSLP